VKILVTGANGFLGRKVVEAFLKKGHQVRALVRPSSDVELFNFAHQPEIFRADLRVSRDLEDSFRDIDVLVHLASAVSGAEEVQLASTVAGTERLLDAMSRTQVKRLVLASSFSVYGWQRVKNLLTEESPLEEENLYQRDPYAVAKIVQERAVTKMSLENNWKLTVLRPGLIWGHGHEQAGATGQRMGDFQILIGPLRELPITYVDNCADAFVAAVESPEAEGQSFNVTDDQGVSASKFFNGLMEHEKNKPFALWAPYHLSYLIVYLAYQLVQRIFKGKGKVPTLLVPCRFEGRFKPVKFSSKKLRAATGWQPKLNYQECLVRTYSE